MANYTREIAHMLDRLNTKILTQDKNGYFRKDLKVKLNLVELLLLKQLGESGEVKLNQLIKTLEVDRNLITTTVKRLSSLKLVQKRADEIDGRGQVIVLLPAGKELYNSLITQQSRELDFILDDVTINEEKTILKFISKMVQYHTDKFEIK
ncbi:MarR family transcriptional regulator [Fusibacter bizertensis]|jgi:Transcriptional regulators|uniref:MarR family transcriptional regulator n=1 Tax=Fusibacter bizertensis TaxID=1488331 RepID=A0ABT6NE08_9FIRM|nr:MarR family transcriptional regulator [Fusibacter bizertensis]MDH8678626.1 MarR family transcriptional regulator [Fusibacter bizertensis]